MSEKTAIAWTDATWNPVTGCSKVSPGCALGNPAAEGATVGAIVAADETAGPPAAVIPPEGDAAATRALHERIHLTRALSLRVTAAVVRGMVEAGLDDLKILRAVVYLVAVAVVDDFTRFQRPPQYFLGHQAVLVDVTPRVRSGMIGPSDQDIPIRRDGPAAFPVGITRSGMNDSHRRQYSTRECYTEGR